jgi:hypothetical protein
LQIWQQHNIIGGKLSVFVSSSCGTSGKKDRCVVHSSEELHASIEILLQIWQQHNIIGGFLHFSSSCGTSGKKDRRVVSFIAV